MNVVVLRGRLSRPVEERALPSGDRLWVLDLTVPPADEASKAASVPLAWFGAPAWVADLDVGDELVVTGSVRRRFFRGANGLQSRTEVVVEAGAPARRTARASDVVERARRALDAEETAPERRRGRRRAPATFA